MTAAAAAAASTATLAQLFRLDSSKVVEFQDTENDPDVYNDTGSDHDDDDDDDFMNNIQEFEEDERANDSSRILVSDT